MSTYEPEIFHSWNTYKQLLLSHYPVYQKDSGWFKTEAFPGMLMLRKLKERDINSFLCNI